MSRQKYNYLPMSYNDLIFAVVGEELGFVGCIAMIAVFIIYLWAGLKIAENASDHLGRLIAAGSSAMVFIQLLLNLMGVLALFPLSGKPVPFVSYGGSSVMSSMLLAALTLNVSLRSTLPETAADRFRSYLHVAEDRPRTSRSHLRLLDDEDAYDEYGVSEATPRSRRSASDRSQSQGRERFRVVEGGAQEAATSADREAEREAKPGGSVLGSARRVTSWGNAHGFERLNLNDESAADRLRRRD
jgi:cell division protein FtsW